jgi:hypothetical protein
VEVDLHGATALTPRENTKTSTIATLALATALAPRMLPKHQLCLASVRPKALATPQRP